MQTTSKLGLKKPELTDSPPDITVLNHNWDLIDQQLYEASQPPANGSITDSMLGNRTPDQALAPATPGTGTLTQLLSWLANRIKAITGKANWWDAPDTTLAAANTHINATSAHSATSSATASRIMMRDATGRAKVAAPSAADDIARKDTVDAVQGNLTTHLTDYVQYQMMVSMGGMM